MENQKQMIPRIFEVSEDKTRLKITPECYTIPELKAIMDKFDMLAEPYLLYVYNHTHPEAPYINLPEDEKEENIIYDIMNVFDQATYGDIDFEEPLLKKAIDSLNNKFLTTTRRYFLSSKRLMDKNASFAQNIQIVDGKDGNWDQVQRMLREVGQTMKSFKEAEKQADDELGIKMKGNNELGGY
jgi:hypothetical protein